MSNTDTTEIQEFESGSTTYKNTDADRWVFEVDGFHLDAVQQAKSEISEQIDSEYQHLCGKIVEYLGTRFVVVIDAGGQSR